MTSRARYCFTFSALQAITLMMLVMNTAGANRAAASSLTIRDIQVKNNQIEIQLDGVATKSSLDLDYVRDVVQFSIQNATLYPAKILHVEKQTFNKVFAYQYSPNLVRVRLSVDGKADDYRDQVKFSQKGKTITISFPQSVVHTADDAHEKSLIARVLGTAQEATKNSAEVKTAEKNADSNADKNNEKLAANSNQAVKVEALTDSGKAAQEKAMEKTTAAANAVLEEPKPHHLTGKTGSLGETLGTKKNGQSPMRSFFAMFLVVGGLGLVLIYVKKRQKGGQAKRVGDNWLSNLLPQNMRKSKSLIEIVGTHPIGPKQNITVIRIRGQQFVLGVTQDNVQLISQLDADDSDTDLLEDPAVAASIGKMFGSKPKIENTATPNLGASFGALLKSSVKGITHVTPAKNTAKTTQANPTLGASASAAVGRNAYSAGNQTQRTNLSFADEMNAQFGAREPSVNSVSALDMMNLTQVPEIRAQRASIQNTNQNQAAAGGGVRDQIKKRLEGMKNA
jgi:flagellar biogenesis protein FliO